MDIDELDPVVAVMIDAWRAQSPLRAMAVKAVCPLIVEHLDGLSGLRPLDRGHYPILARQDRIMEREFELDAREAKIAEREKQLAGPATDRDAPLALVQRLLAWVSQDEEALTLFRRGLAEYKGGMYKTVAESVVR